MLCASSTRFALTGVATEIRSTEQSVRHLYYIAKLPQSGLPGKQLWLFFCNTGFQSIPIYQGTGGSLSGNAEPGRIGSDRHCCF